MALLARDANSALVTLPNAGTDQAFGAVATFTTPAATAATDVLTFQGPANGVARLPRIKLTINALAAPTAGAILVQLIRQTAIHSGSSPAVTPTPLDSRNTTPAGTAVLTPGGNGTGTKILAAEILTVPAAIQASSVEFSVGASLAEPILLSGTSDFVAVNVTCVAANESLAGAVVATITESLQ